MLKTSKVKIGKVSDPEINKFFRDSIRGGMSFISKRYAKSPCNIHSSNEKKSNICNIDCNNLYGSMMLLPLPIGDYKFLKSCTIKKIQNILKKKKSSNFKNINICFWKLI